MILRNVVLEASLAMIESLFKSADEGYIDKSAFNVLRNLPISKPTANLFDAVYSNYFNQIDMAGWKHMFGYSATAHETCLDYIKNQLKAQVNVIIFSLIAYRISSFFP